MKIEKFCPGRYEELYRKSRRKIEEEELISESLLKSALLDIKRIGSVYSLILDEAYKQYRNNDKKNIGLWNELLKHIKDDFFPNLQPKLEGVMKEGVDGYSFNFIYSCNNKIVQIQIPNVKNVNVKNIKFANWGRYSLSEKETDSLWKHIIQSYDEKEIANEIEKICNKKYLYI